MPLLPVETRGPSILAQLADTFVEGEARNKDAIHKVMYANKQSRVMADIAGSYREGIANAKNIGEVLNLGSTTMSKLLQVDSPSAEKFAGFIEKDSGIRARMMGTTPNTFEEALLSGKIDEPTYKRYSEMKPSSLVPVVLPNGQPSYMPKPEVGKTKGAKLPGQDALAEAAKRQGAAFTEAEQKEDRKLLDELTKRNEEYDADIANAEAADAKLEPDKKQFTNIVTVGKRNQIANQKRIDQILKKNKWDAEGNPVGGEKTKDSFEVGQLYQDASGNKAKYLGNGKWENVK